MRATILEEGTPRRPPTSPTVADSGAWERAELQPIMRNLGRIVRRDQGPTSLGVATPVTAWQQEVAEGASACAAATACTWRVGEGGAPAAYAQSRTPERRPQRWSIPSLCAPRVIQVCSTSRSGASYPNSRCACHYTCPFAHHLI